MKVSFTVAATVFGSHHPLNNYQKKEPINSVHDDSRYAPIKEVYIEIEQIISAHCFKGQICEIWKFL